MYISKIFLHLFCLNSQFVKVYYSCTIVIYFIADDVPSMLLRVCMQCTCTCMCKTMSWLTGYSITLSLNCKKYLKCTELPYVTEFFSGSICINVHVHDIVVENHTCECCTRM